MDETARAKYALYAAIFLTFIGYAGHVTGMEPVNNQFFPFAAWGYILFADNVGWRIRGSSPLISRPAEFLFLAAWSVALGGLAELLNLRLNAWGYVDVCSAAGPRWAGRLAAWAVVLPSFAVTAELLAAFSFFHRARSAPFTIRPWAPAALAAAGGILLAAALTFPSVAWPLALPAFFLAAEAANLALGLPSLLRELAGGIPGKTLRLAAAGAVCGVLWTWWNAAAGASWEFYLPPYFGGHGWSALPGYPALALAAYSMHSAATWLREGRSWEEGSWTPPGKKPSAALKAAAGVVFIITSYLALRAVDANTVKLFLAWI